MSWQLDTLPDNTALTQEFCDPAKFSGILILDGKFVKVKGHKAKIPFIYAIGYLTHDVPVGIVAGDFAGAVTTCRTGAGGCVTSTTVSGGGACVTGACVVTVTCVVIVADFLAFLLRLCSRWSAACLLAPVADYAPVALCVASVARRVASVSWRVAPIAWRLPPVGG